MQVCCSKRKKRGPKTGSKRQPASDVENLVYKMLAAPEDALVIRDILVELAKYARSLEDQLDRLKPPVILSSSPGTISCAGPLLRDVSELLQNSRKVPLKKTPTYSMLSHLDLLLSWVSVNSRSGMALLSLKSSYKRLWSGNTRPSTKTRILGSIAKAQVL